MAGIDRRLTMLPLLKRITRRNEKPATVSLVSTLLSMPAWYRCARSTKPFGLFSGVTPNATAPPAPHRLALLAESAFPPARFDVPLIDFGDLDSCESFDAGA